MFEQYREGTRGMPSYDELAALLNMRTPLHVFGAANSGQNAQLARDAQTIIDADVAALPKDCSGTPASCPDNEGHGCACSPSAAPQVVADERELPPLPAFDIEGGYYDSESGYSKKTMQDYARAALTAAPVQAQEPFMYGIMGPDGKAHMDENCVGPDAASLYAELNGLNDSPDTGYRIVKLFTAPVQPVAVPDVLRKAFVTLESGSGRYSIVMKFNQKTDAFAVHNFLLGVGGKDYNFAAPAAQGDAREMSEDEIKNLWRKLCAGGKGFGKGIGVNHIVRAVEQFHYIPLAIRIGEDTIRLQMLLENDFTKEYCDYISDCLNEREAVNFIGIIDSAIAAKAAS